MAHMRPYINETSGWNVATECGTTFVSADHKPHLTPEEVEALDKGGPSPFSDWVEGKRVESWEAVNVFEAYMSAPGYMDRTGKNFGTWQDWPRRLRTRKR